MSEQFYRDRWETAKKHLLSTLDSANREIFNELFESPPMPGDDFPDHTNSTATIRNVISNMDANLHRHLGDMDRAALGVAEGRSNDAFHETADARARLRRALEDVLAHPSRGSRGGPERAR